MFSWLTGSKKKTPTNNRKRSEQQQQQQQHRSSSHRASFENNPMTPRTRQTSSSIGSNYRATSISSSLIPRSLSANSIPALMEPQRVPVLSAGYLTLDEGEKDWKRYWFVLSGSCVSDVALRYYLHTESAREGASSSLGCMFLRGSKVVVIQEMIRITCDDSTVDEWFLCADTLKEASEWSDKIEMASRAPEQCVEAIGGWGMGGEVAERMSYTACGSSVGSCSSIDGGSSNSSGGVNGTGPTSTTASPISTATNTSTGSNKRTDMASTPQESKKGRNRRASTKREEIQIQKRRTLDLLHQRHDEFVMCFKQCHLDRLREMTASGGLQKSTLRSLVWMKLLGHFPQTTNVQSNVWMSIMKDSREEYDAVSKSVLVSSREVTGLVSKEVKGDNMNGSSGRSSNSSSDANNKRGRGKPLSSDTAGAIFQYMLKSDYQRLIWKDVIRTQQSIAWFVEKKTQDLCAKILLVWSLAHPHVGYKQGMNELLAVVIYLVCTERGDINGESHINLLKSVQKEETFDTKQMNTHHLLNVLLDPKYCEADTYIIFDLIMTRMEPVFCPTDEHPDTIYTTKRDSMSLLQRFSRVQAEIVYCENQQLAEHMILCGVEPQMYLLRWMRLLCSREFNMPGLWLVWDSIFAVNPDSFEFHDFICSALVLSLNDTIIIKDDPQSILYELKHFTSGFNIDIMKLIKLARDIKTRLTGKLMDPSTIIEEDAEEEMVVKGEDVIVDKEDTIIIEKENEEKTDSSSNITVPPSTPVTIAPPVAPKISPMTVPPLSPKRKGSNVDSTIPSPSPHKVEENEPLLRI